MTGGALGLLSLILASPFLQGIFHFEAVEVYQLALCLITGFLSILISESVKLPAVQRLFGKA